MPLEPSNSSENQRNRAERVLKNLQYANRIIKTGKNLHRLLKTDLSFDEIEDEVGGIIGDAFYSKDLDNGDLPIRDYLQNLKIGAQRVASSTRIFSRGRQGLKRELDIIYEDVQADESLSDNERQGFLRNIAEIRDIVQPPSPPRNPPSR